MAKFIDMIDQNLIFFCSPRTSLQSHFLAARSSSHFLLNYFLFLLSLSSSFLSCYVWDLLAESSHLAYIYMLFRYPLTPNDIYLYIDQNNHGSEKSKPSSFLNWKKDIPHIWPFLLSLKLSAALFNYTLWCDVSQIKRGTLIGYSHK